MAAAATTLSLPPRSTSTLLLLTSPPKPVFRTTRSKPSSSATQPTTRSRRGLVAGLSSKRSGLWSVSAAGEDALPSESLIEKAQQAAPSTSDDISSTIISFLLFIAFIGLTILTIGVIYLGVTDFLQKRERDKFEKEEAGQKKKRGKKGKVKAKAGPRGFGQKVEEGENDDDDDGGGDD